MLLHRTNEDGVSLREKRYQRKDDTKAVLYVIKTVIFFENNEPVVHPADNKFNDSTELYRWQLEESIQLKSKTNELCDNKLL